MSNPFDDIFNSLEKKDNPVVSDGMVGSLEKSENPEVNDDIFDSLDDKDVKPITNKSGELIDVTDDFNTKSPNEIISDKKKTIPEEDILQETPEEPDKNLSIPEEEIDDILQEEVGKSLPKQEDEEDILQELPEEIEPANFKKIENEIGIMLHFGLYSIPGFCDIELLRKKKNKNGSEWYYNKLLEDDDSKTKIFHKKYLEPKGISNYFNLKKVFDFKIQNFNFESIFNKLLNENITYIILTAKHHDGFCLWDTNTTINKSKRNLVKEFIDKSRENGIKVGLYYSWFEFGKKIDGNFIENTIRPQINELQEQFAPDYWWFDGEKEIKTKNPKIQIYNIVKELKKKSIINSHIPPPPPGDDLNIIDIKTYVNKMPLERPPYNWEYMFTIGHSRGNCRYQKQEDYKTGKDINNLYKKVSEMNGSFLINFGQKNDGTINENEYKSFKEFMTLFEKVTPKEISQEFDFSDEKVKKKKEKDKNEDYLDKPSTDRDILKLNNYITQEKDEKKYLFNEEIIKEDIENIKNFYKKYYKYNRKYIPLRNKFRERKITLFELNQDILKIKCPRPECPNGTGVIFKKDKTKHIIDNKFIIKQNELIITGCPACQDKIYKKNSYGYLYSYLKENKNKINKIKRLLSIQTNEIANELFLMEDVENLNLEYSLYDDFKEYYLKKDENLKIIEKKILFNKKNIYTKQLEDIETILNEKMEEYKELPIKNDDPFIIKTKIELYKEISFIKENLRKLKYNKINEKENIIIQINKDEEYPEVNDINEDDNEISSPYIEIKKNIYNIPDSLQIIL